MTGFYGINYIHNLCKLIGKKCLNRLLLIKLFFFFGFEKIDPDLKTFILDLERSNLRMKFNFPILKFRIYQEKLRYVLLDFRISRLEKRLKAFRA